MLERVRRLRPAWILVGLILLAAGLRLWRLDVLPPGLFHDEAYNGLDARRVLSGAEHPVFFTANNGREPLFIYLQALSVAALGATPYALRVVSAVIGILTIPATYFAAYTILRPTDPAAKPGRQTAWLALIAAAGMAISYWHLSLSRLGFRAGLLIPFSALAIAFFYRGWIGNRRRDFVWAGLWLAVSQYTYLAARILPLVIAAFVATEIVVDLWLRKSRGGALWTSWRSRLGGLILLALVAGLGVLPLAWTLLRDPALLTSRTADVSIWSAGTVDWPGPPAERFRANVVLVARAFYDRGDTTLRHNLPGRPINDPLLAVLFTLGWLTALWQIRRPRSRLVLAWFVLMLMPSLLSSSAPHFLRSAGALPPLVLLYALGAESIAAWVQRIAAHRVGAANPGAAGIATILAMLLLMVVYSGGLTSYDYFRRWARSPGLGSEFEVQLQLAAQEAVTRMHDAGAEDGLLLPYDLYLQPHMGFALGQVTATEGLPSPGAAPPMMAAVPGERVISSVLLWRDRDQLVSTWLQPISEQDEQAIVPLADLRWPTHQEGWPQLQIQEGPALTHLELRKIRYPLDVAFANGLRLVGYDVEQDSVYPAEGQDRVNLTLFWLPQAADGPNAEAFAQLNVGGAIVKDVNGPIPRLELASSLRDGAPVIEDTRSLTVSVQSSPTKAYFEVGLYERRPRDDGAAAERIDIVDDAGRAVADRIDLGPIMIGGPPPAADLSDLQDLNVEFGERIALIGWQAAHDIADPNTLRVDLVWRALDRMTTGYTAFVHLVDSQGQIISQQDQPPGGANNPTHLWVPGETVRSTLTLTLPAEALSSQLQLRIGLYEPVSGQRLPVTAAPDLPAATPADDYVLLPLDHPTSRTAP